MRSLLLLIWLALALGTAASAKLPPGIHTVEVPTTHIAAPAMAMIVVPEYEGADTVASALPSVYLLNGYSGGYADWSQKFDLQELADRYGVVIVCADGRDSWYWDSPVDPSMQMESYMVDDLVSYVDSVAPTAAQAASRAITGLSMGGHGALWLAISHPDVWANVASMSGGVDISKFPNRWKAQRSLGRYEKHPRRWVEHSVMHLASTRLQPGQLNIYFDCGTEDFFYDVNCSLDSLLTSRSIAHTYTTRPGQHSWSYWQKSLPAHLDFFTSHFPTSD